MLGYNRVGSQQLRVYGLRKVRTRSSDSRRGSGGSREGLELTKNGVPLNLGDPNTPAAVIAGPQTF